MAFRKTTIGDSLKLESILFKKMAKTGTGWKISQVKNEIINSKMNEDNLRSKKIP